MNTQFSLYIDHQSIAPLVRLLENTVQTCRREHGVEYQSYQIRMELYQHFLSIIHTLYLDRHPQIKIENGLIKLENDHEVVNNLNENLHIEGLITINPNKTTKKKTRGLSNKNLQVEVQLIQWIQSCDKRIFDKKEIDEKYQELFNDEKKSITLKKIKEIVEKYKFPALIVRTRNKEEHFFGVDLNVSTQTIVKKEEERVNQSFWVDDDNETIKNSMESMPEIKQQQNSYAQEQPKTPPTTTAVTPTQAVSNLLTLPMQQESSTSFQSINLAILPPK